MASPPPATPSPRRAPGGTAADTAAAGGSGPNVSVIICNLNGMRFLPRLLATLRAQRGVTTEIIVADRESTDGSR